eukprot:symbB.v1.2.039877.t1/scaffold6846.1/size15074/1
MAASSREPGSALNPFFRAVSRFRQRRWDECIDLCTELLEQNPRDQAAWFLKCRALTSKQWIDDVEIDEEGVADLLLDENAVAQAPRPGTSLNRPRTENGAGPSQVVRPVSASGRPLTGFARPGTNRPTSSSAGRDITTAMQGNRPGTSRPLTSMGRLIRLGTASMQQDGGEFVRLESLDLQKYAQRPAIAKALCDYMCLLQLASTTLVMSSPTDGIAPAAGPAFVGPTLGVRPQHPPVTRAGTEAPSSSAANAALPMFLLGTAGAAACRRAARGVSSAARKAVPKQAQKSHRRGFTALHADAQPQRVAMQATAVAEAPTKTYEIGEKVHGWTCVRTEYVKEFGCSGYVFEHDKTGAELLSMVQPADENKTFSVVFRTPPENSNGIAHVLEHSVLCGSRKYPLKEPFVELMKSSLQTFLNAMTFPDRTCYPVASCNLKDFYNLIDVYLDAVFFPRALNDPRVLAQEGWHYEIEKKDDPLTFKGVVFNEMKGVYSNPDAAHGRTANQSMFPDNQYGVDSGGDPKEIPNLTFDYFKDFHGKYYHPSNAKFWFYGDDPADARLELVDKYLSEFEKIEVNSKINVQPLFSEPRKIVDEFAVGEDEDISKKTMVSINWVVSEGKEDLQTSLAMQFLNYLMMGTAASPLYKALVDSGLGSRVIGGGLDDGMLQATFSVGLKDLKEEDVPKVEELVMKTLEELAEKGFESDDIKAAVNTIEFQNRELNTGSFPKGLALLFAANNNWNYDKDPFEALKFEAPLEELKARLEKGEPVFEDLIKTKILKNSHKVIVESRPSKELGKKMEEEEKTTLQKHRETLTENDIEELISETVKLKEIQETPDSPEAMKTVPGLELSDIPKESPKIPTELVEGSEPTVLRHALPTSGVIYTDLAFDLSRVPEELLPMVPLFTRALKQLGTAKGDFVSLTRRVGMSTGGISASTICMNKKGDTEPVAYLFMRGWGGMLKGGM